MHKDDIQAGTLIHRANDSVMLVTQRRDDQLYGLCAGPYKLASCTLDLSQYDDDLNAVATDQPEQLTAMAHMPPAVIAHFMGRTHTPLQHFLKKTRTATPVTPKVTATTPLKAEVVPGVVLYMRDKGVHFITHVHGNQVHFLDGHNRGQDRHLDLAQLSNNNLWHPKRVGRGVKCILNGVHPCDIARLLSKASAVTNRDINALSSHVRADLRTHKDLGLGTVERPEYQHDVLRPIPRPAAPAVTPAPAV